MGFWLSHVPRARLGRFPDTFAGVGSSPAALSRSSTRAGPRVERHQPPDSSATTCSIRRLNDGREFTITEDLLGASRAARRALAGRRLRRDADSPAHAALLPARAEADGRRFRLRRCRSTDKRIATVGSGVMAEAMIAGLLRGEQVAPDQIVASHPRADRRDELISSYGIRTVEDNVAAVDERRRHRAGHQAADARPRRPRARAVI